MPTTPLHGIALPGADCATVLWRQSGELFATVVVKATFSLVPDGPMRLIEPRPLLARDQHHDDSPARSLRAAGELAPRRPRADVTLAGHAHAPQGQPVPALGVRLALYRGKQPLLDKTLHVYGDRGRDGDARAATPVPFAKLPMVYERTWQDDTNPAGLRPEDTPPNVVDDAHPAEGAAGFGPLSPYAKSRRQLLGGVSRKALEQAIAEVPEGFDWSYFQAAPADQRVEPLQGDEWLVLDNLAAARPRLASQLPQIHAEAHVLALDQATASACQLSGPLVWSAVPLAADGLHVDGDAERATVTWRGSFRVPSEQALTELRVVGGVASAGARLALPDPSSLRDQADAEPAAAAEPPPARQFDSGQTVTADGQQSPATPFEAARGKSVWGQVEIKPIPQLIGAGVVTYVSPSNATITLSAEQRRQALEKASAPFPMAEPGTAKPTAPAGAPYSDEAAPTVQAPIGDTTKALDDRFAGTRKLSEGEQQAAADRALAPFQIATPGQQSPAADLSGTPWAHRAEPELPSAPADPSAAPVEASRFFHELPRSERDEEPPSEAAAPAVPERTTEAIPTYARSPLTLVTMAWQHRPPRDSLTVFVKGTFEILPGQAARLCEETELPTGELHLDDDPARSVRYPSDFAHFKPRADVVLTGSAYPPRTDGVRRGAAVQARFGFGKRENRFDRAVAVLGDRHWEKALIALAPTEPQPFDRIPLQYEHAFGGPGWDDNPVGMGYGSNAAADGLARLPNLERPDALINSPADRPEPACFAPVPMGWMAHAGHLGSYGSRWLRDRWPYFPDDFDWSYFQCAPEAQQLEYLDGDEPFSLVAMHPEHPRIEGSLPGLRPRAFMCIEGADTGASGVDLAFEEVVLRLDTAVFDVDAMRLHLVWRGIVEVQDEHAPEIRALYLTTEPLGQAKTNEQAYAEFLATVAPIEPVMDSPEGEPGPANDVDAADDEPDAEEAQLRAELDAAQAKRQEALAAAGIAPSPPAEPPAPAPPPTPEALAASLRASGASDSAVAELLAALALLPDEAAEQAQQPSVRQRVQAALAAGASLDGADLAGGDLSGLDLSKQSLREANLADALLTGTVLQGADLSGATLMRADLTQAQLGQCQLAAADLTEAVLDHAVLDEAVLTDADLSDAHGHGASFRSAAGERVQLSGGSWVGAHFEQARLPRLCLSECEIDQAVFDDADLTGAHLLDARGCGISLRGTRLEDAVCDGAALAEANLWRAHAKGSVWEQAQLEGASFLEAELTEASFVRASLARADFSGATMREARFKRAAAAEAKFLFADLKAAQFERSDLRMADFTGANLYGAETWKADTAGATFTDALVGMSKLEGKS